MINYLNYKMGNYCVCNKDVLLKQKNEYKNKKVRINKIGNYKQYPVYYDKNKNKKM